MLNNIKALIENHLSIMRILGVVGDGVKKHLESVTFVLKDFFPSFFPFSRADLRSAHSHTNFSFIAVWKYQFNSSNWKRACHMDRDHYKANAHCDELFHRQFSDGWCRYRIILHSISISSSSFTTVGSASIYVSFLSLHTNPKRECFHFYTHCYRDWPTQSHIKSVESTLVKTSIKNYHCRNLVGLVGVGSANKLGLEGCWSDGSIWN